MKKRRPVINRGGYTRVEWIRKYYDTLNGIRMVLTETFEIEGSIFNFFIDCHNYQYNIKIKARREFFNRSIHYFRSSIVSKWNFFFFIIIYLFYYYLLFSSFYHILFYYYIFIIILYLFIYYYHFVGRSREFFKKKFEFLRNPCQDVNRIGFLSSLTD